MQMRDMLADFETQFESMRERGEMPDDAAIKRRLHDLERLRT